MPLKLTITSYQRLSPGQETTKVLDHGAISIGRAVQNDWVLQDPERILSKSHCTVEYREGAYWLTDLSVNGTFLNDSEERIPRDQTVALQDGDHFILGEYEIAVTLLPGAGDLGDTTPREPLTDIVPSPGGEWSATPGPAFPDWGGAGQPYPAGPQPGAVATEPPFEGGGPEKGIFEPPDYMPEIPPAPTPAEISEPPASVVPASAAEATGEPLIPDDWWLMPPTPPVATPITPPSAIQTPAQSAAAPLPRGKIPAEPLLPLQGLEKPVPQPQRRPLPVAEHPEPSCPLPSPVLKAEIEPPAPDIDVLLRAFLEGAGLRRLRLTPEQLPDVMANLGGMLRETVQGMMEILRARGDVKGEFGVERTFMGPVENNPLKTPPGRPPLSPEEVMTLLLVGRKEAYMPAVQAVREGFNDIKAHQLAVMAGIQAALTRLLARFDPANLETSLGQSVLDNIWPANRKAKYWDLFTAEYQAIAREAEDDFNKLFGGEFRRGYEERVRGH